jgi:hypothetical protein
MGTPTDRFLSQITSSKRVVILGGLAVIAHGLSRSTDDADIWLEPMSDAKEWCDYLESMCNAFGALTIHRLPRWTPVSGDTLVDAIEENGVLRIKGLDCPLDIFRKPNEFEADQFEEVYDRGTEHRDGTTLPHPIDLIVTKSFTNRDKDYMDVAHLESITRAEYLSKLPTATHEEASFMLGRYAEWRVLQCALTNPSPAVQDLATGLLKEFAEAGDPFSKDILEGKEVPPAP